MKKNLFIISILTFAFLITNCEDKINVDLNTAPPKLVIDAALKWQKGTTGKEQIIKLSTTTDYYSASIPKVHGAIVKVINSSNTIFDFIETPNTGDYICTNFVPVLNETYTLVINYNGQTYTATETLLATPTIDHIEQKTVQGFGGDVIQVKFFYQDNGNETNFYLISFKNNTKVFPEYDVVKDRFFQGNQMFGFYSDDKLKAGNILDMRLQGISERYFNYFDKLISISGSSGNPFSTPPATLRGNIINQTNADDFPLGYFSLGETDSKTYTVQ